MDAKLAEAALHAAQYVLELSGRNVTGVILLLELDDDGVTVACDLPAPSDLPRILAEGALKTRAAMQ